MSGPPEVSGSPEMASPPSELYKNTLGTSEAQGSKHGSAANSNDPAGVPQSHHGSMDVAVSDDSLTLTPPHPRRERPGSRPGSVKRGGHLGGQASGRRKTSSLPRPPARSQGGDQGHALIPIRAPQKSPDEHELVIPVDGSTEARLRALEAQQRIDHSYFVKVRETLGILHNRSLSADKKLEDITAGQDNNVQVGVQLRREVYGIRDKFDNELKNIYGVVSDQTGAKLTAIDAQIAKLQSHIEESKVMEQKLMTPNWELA